MSKLSEQFQSVYQKLEMCFSLQKNVSSHLLEYENQARFDFDAICNSDFIEKLFQFVSDVSIYIVYVDITDVLIQKQVAFDKSELLSTSVLSEIRKNHAILYDCKIEGSYFLCGDSDSWLVFYDAQSDLGLLFSDDSQIVGGMSEYVMQ